MKLLFSSTIITTALGLASSTSLPKCSSRSTSPCKCPTGTNYSECVTFAVIGAPAKDIEHLVNDFFQCAWLGVVPYATRGPDNRPGQSIRSAPLYTSVGTYGISELLTEYHVDIDGSFLQKFEQLPSTVPVKYKSGNGSFSGYWVSIEGTSIFQNETRITWSDYACDTGRVRDFAAFHESAINNATNVLKTQGKIMGTNIVPYSIQSFQSSSELRRDRTDL
ncbi:hypothetical protein F5B20DRAFT_561053 [Whalleya microplaca]|nr:hypothetical protein F5B20DRAFT_561053 [Whalleya microplaca]